MAEVVADKLAGEVVDSLLTKVKREIGYAWNCKENVEKLRSEKNKLKSMMERVEQRLKLAIRNGDEILAGVEQWVEEALAHISTTEEFLQEEVIAKKTCFKLRMCVNPDNLRHYGKHAANKVPFLEQHQKDGAAFEGEISIPTPALGMLDLYPRENIDDLDTHKSVLEKIIESVKDESTQVTGIYGIGGVGKTTLAREVAARVKDLFAHLEFVTVSQPVDAASIKKQVENSAKRIKKGEKVLIILDDVWTEVKLHTVGIPCGTRYPSCKILLTSRQRSVCTAMNAHSIIYVECLTVKEAWALFKRVVSERVETNAKLKKVAMKIVRGCGGLPLILQAVGKALKDEDNFMEWEKALDNIEKHATLDIDPTIKVEFAHLRLSYDYLKSEEAKSVFLLCSMFPYDFHIPLESLAYYCVGLQIFTCLDSLETARNKVQRAVKILKSSCLLLNGSDESSTKMHDVVRQVALLIASKDDNKFLVEAGKNLTEWEPRIGSLESYTGISLMFNKICKLPVDYEHKIPLLNILLIQQNCNLSEISDKFTQAMKEAKVLDFEDNNITSLPKSLNQLTRLCMLNLGGNRFLRDVSILGELNHLEILILSKTGITEIPQEIGKLVNLRLFHAAQCPDLSHIAPGVLSKLHWLEELSIGYYPVEEGNDKSLLEIGKLSNLAFLNLYVPHICPFPEGDYLKSLKRFSIQVGKDDSCTGVVSDKGNLILDTPYLDISHLMHLRKLIEVSDHIFLRCSNLLCLVDLRVLDEMETFHPSETHDGVKENSRFLSELEELTLFDLSCLKMIWNCPDQYVRLNNLVTLEISFCPMLEKLFTFGVAQGLDNLQKLRIQWCGSLKEVISDRDEETSTCEIDTVVPAKNIVFPQLAHIRLNQMLNLTSFYPRNATVEYPSLVEVVIWECNALEKWGYGTHDTPNLQLVKINDTKVNGSTIDEALAKYREEKLREKQLWNERLKSTEAGPSSHLLKGNSESEERK